MPPVPMLIVFVAAEVLTFTVVADVALKIVPIVYKSDKYDVDPTPIPPVMIKAPDVVPEAAVLFANVEIPAEPTVNTLPPLVAT